MAAESKEKSVGRSNGAELVSQKAREGKEPSIIEDMQKRHQFSKSSANLAHGGPSQRKKMSGAPLTGSELQNTMKELPSMNNLTSVAAEMQSSLKDRVSPSATPRSNNNTSKKAATQRSRLQLSGTAMGPARGRSN